MAHPGRLPAEARLRTRCLEGFRMHTGPRAGRLYCVGPFQGRALRHPRRQSRHGTGSAERRRRADSRRDGPRPTHPPPRRLPQPNALLPRGTRTPHGLNTWRRSTGLPATFGGTAADIPRAEHDGARHNTHSIWSGHAAPPARTGSLAPAGPPNPALHLVVSREIKGWDVVRGSDGDLRSKKCSTEKLCFRAGACSRDPLSR